MRFIWLALLVACGGPHTSPTTSAVEPEPVREPVPVPVPAPSPTAPVSLPATSLGTVVVADTDRCGLLLDAIYFTENSATISAAQAPVLDQLALMFRCFYADGEITRWGVVGHADDHEDDTARISHERARAVTGELVARGVPVEALAPEAVGATQPLDPGQTASGRAKNRHVSFSVLVRRN